MTAPRRCYVHIGLPKTGTSYLQSIFWRSGVALAEQDLAMLPASKSTTFYLMLAIRGRLREGMDPPVAFTALDTFRQEAAEARFSRALVTQELLSAATSKQVGTLLGALDGYEVHLVVTVRDLATQIPSAWQQMVKARGVTPYGDYLENFTGGNRGGRPPRTYDLHGVLDRWGSHVPPGRVHIVTVPRRGTPAGVLLQRFCTVLKVDPGRLDTETNIANTSLGLVQAELLRRTNVALGDRLPHPRAGYRRQGKGFLAGKVLRPQGGEPLRLPLHMADWCTESSRSIVERLANGGYDVVGDLDDLIPDASAFTRDDQEVSDAQVAQAAAAALASILVLRADETKALARLKDRGTAPSRKLTSWQRQIGRLASGPAGFRQRIRGGVSRLRRG